MKIDIDGLTEAELVDLNHRIVQRLRFMQKMRAHRAMMDFSLGERVWFQPDGRPPIAGVITKFNQKTVTVITETGEHWNVSPSMLRRVGETDTGAASNDVVQLPKR